MSADRHRLPSFCAPLRPPAPGVLERTGASARLDLCRLVPSVYRRSVPERSKLWISTALPLVPSVVPPSCSSSSSSSHVSSSIRMRQRPEGSKKTDSMRYIRVGFGVKYFGFQHIKRCFYLDVFLRGDFT
ncbi:hypothetical protein MUK42_00428 [Musa troglodytarum]|uniref:Uncharacterized protein n=1 Tax=Musa troglodytarum TaxID=320322 RepID=A0A9E7FDA7_9LILI|nr:hypothetical protein MUK42_00428 [Musa troglodytarum]